MLFITCISREHCKSNKDVISPTAFHHFWFTFRKPANAPLQKRSLYITLGRKRFSLGELSISVLSLEESQCTDSVLQKTLQWRATKIAREHFPVSHDFRWFSSLKLQTKHSKRKSRSQLSGWTMAIVIIIITSPGTIHNLANNHPLCW